VSSGRANWGQSKFFNFYASPGSKTQAVSKKLKCEIRNTMKGA